VQLLAKASTFLIDKCYASTFVSADADECRDVELAFTFAEEAVAQARAVVEAVAQTPSSSHVVECGSRVRSGPRPQELTHSTSAAALRSALYALGRACAICGQHVALGAMGDGGQSLPSVQALFSMGQDAFAECLDSSVDVESTRTKAALAELWYCAASSNTARAQVFVPTAPGHERFETLAGLDYQPPQLDHMQQSIVWCVRLTYGSLALMDRCCGEFEALGQGESASMAQLLKDLGKVHGFARHFGMNRRLMQVAAVAPRQDHDSEAQAKLDKALELQTRLQGERHKNTANVRRLLGARAVPRGQGDAADDNAGEQEADAEEQEAGEYLDNLNGLPLEHL